MIKPIDCKHRWEADYNNKSIDPTNIGDLELMFTFFKIKCGMCGIRGHYTSEFYAKLISKLEELKQRAENLEKEPVKTENVTK